MKDFPDKLPALSSLGKILFVGSAFPPSTGGSSVVMRELLRGFSADSYSVISPRYLGVAADSAEESRIYRVGAKRLWPARFAAWLRLLQIPFLVAKAVRFARSQSPCAIVAPYPTLDTLLLALIVAKNLKISFYPYLHDTIAEAHEKSTLKWVARAIQWWVFRDAKRIMVMSEGMAELYKNKYNLSSVPILHPYHETIVEKLDECNNGKLFWSGNIYGVNDHSFLRIVKVASKMGVTTVVATLNSSVKEFLCDLKEKGCLIEITSYQKREDYIKALRLQMAHILVLNDSSLSEWGDEELSTAFPTKTPEFLASGRPILVMCPERYSLAKFFHKYNCGLFLSSRSTDGEIERGIMKIMMGDKEVLGWRRNAMKTARMFDANSVARKFRMTLNPNLAV